MRSATARAMESEFRVCPVCRAPNTVQDAACAACGAALPKVGKMPAPIFEPMPDKQAARAAAHKGVRRGLVVGIGCAAILGLLVARTFRSPSLQDASAQTAGPAVPTPPPPVQPAPDPLAVAGAVPAAPPGLTQPNPYASPVNPYANPYASPNAAALPQPGMMPEATVPAPAAAADPASVPAMVIAAPEPGSRRATAAEA